MHRQFSNDARREVGDTLEDAGEFAADHVAAHSKFKRRSPAGASLKDATEHKLIRTKRHHRLILTSKKRYAMPIELGSRPHVIRSRRAKFLRFIGRDGSVVYARKVNHPGNRPYRFLWNATDAAFRVAGQQLNVGINRLCSKQYR